MNYVRMGKKRCTYQGSLLRFGRNTERSNNNELKNIVYCLIMESSGYSVNNMDWIPFNTSMDA